MRIPPKWSYLPHQSSAKQWLGTSSITFSLGGLHIFVRLGFPCGHSIRVLSDLLDRLSLAVVQTFLPIALLSGLRGLEISQVPMQTCHLVHDQSKFLLTFETDAESQRLGWSFCQFFPFEWLPNSCLWHPQEWHTLIEFGRWFGLVS